MRLVVLHGFTGTPASHWLPWLADEVVALADVAVPALPDTEAPERDTWVAAAGAAIDGRRVPDRLVIVAHSLGTVAALLALRDRPLAPLAGLVLVAPFWSALPSSPELDAFVADLPPLRGTVAMDVPVLVVVSDHDDVVEVERSLAVADALAATVVRVPGGGHFLEREGWTELPVVRDAVLGMLDGRSSPELR